MLFFWFSTVTRLALSWSRLIGTLSFGISVVRNAVTSSSSIGLLSGQRTCVTTMSRSVAVFASRSVSTFALNQNTPNVGSFAPFFVIDAAARPSSVLPSNFSGCG